MIHLFLQRRALVCCAFLLVTARPVCLSAAPTHPSTASAPRPAVGIASVSPQIAAPGDKVTIVLSNARDVQVRSVWFGGRKATIESQRGGVVYVVVPNQLQPDETPPIGVETPIGNPNYTGFRVKSLAIVEAPLTIVKVAPERALPGTLVRLQLSRPLNTQQEIKLLVGATTVPVTLDNGRSILEALVPDVNSGKTLIVLVEGKHSAPYTGFEILEPRLFGIPRAWLTNGVLLLTGLGLLLTLVLRYVWNRNQLEQVLHQYNAIRRFDGQARSEPDHGTKVEGPSEAIPPAVPEPLARLCASGNCILFAGPGLGAQSFLPTRYEALVHLVEKAALDETLQKQLGDALRSGQLRFVAEALASQVDRETLIAELTALYLHNNADVSEAHTLLQRIPFAGILTTGWDELIDKAFDKRRSTVVNGEADPEQAYQQDAFFIARLNGNLRAPQSLVFGEEYYRTVYERPTFARFVASQVLSHPLLFVGMSLSGIEDFFNVFRFPLRATPESYAIVPSTRLWATQQQRFRANYGVELIGFEVTPHHEQLVKFLAELVKRSRAHSSQPDETQPSTAKLHRVRLENIGPFRSLALGPLQDGWNVLLGNNGAGKSTILRAIALGLCGDDPEAAMAGAYLLRRGVRAGNIELQVGDVTYRTELRRIGNRVLTTPAQFALPQKGHSLVLGFPPLRGISSRDPSGPSAIHSSEPRVADLLPLIRGSIDTRLDSLKQWLVNLEVNSIAGNEVSSADAARNRGIVLSFYDILHKFTPGHQVEAGRVDRTTWQVYVTTADGDVPIDNVSQGMSSIFGWVGTLIQRMYEIYVDSAVPTQEPALVLVDEIDAHLHPEWQQVLTSIVKEHFPNVQIIATTHSPLLVAGMKQEELMIARRDEADPSHIDVFRSPISPEGLRADQILTSPIFGLLSTRGPNTNAEMRRLSTLVGMSNRTAEEEAEFRELQTKLMRILTPGESVEDRRNDLADQQAIEARIERSMGEIADASDEVKIEAKKRLDHLMENQK